MIEDGGRHIPTQSQEHARGIPVLVLPTAFNLNSSSSGSIHNTQHLYVCISHPAPKAAFMQSRYKRNQFSHVQNILLDPRNKTFGVLEDVVARQPQDAQRCPKMPKDAQRCQKGCSDLQSQVAEVPWFWGKIRYNPVQVLPFLYGLCLSSFVCATRLSVNF